MGNIHLKLHDGTQTLLQQVRYIPELKRNLISLGMLESNGFWFKSKSGIVKIFKGTQLIIKGIKRNCLYSLVGSTVIGLSIVAAQHDTHATRL